MMTNGKCTKCGESFANCYNAWSCAENMAKKSAAKPASDDAAFFMSMVAMYGGKPKVSFSK